MIARRGVEHGSGLGVYRWGVEQAFALLHWFRRLRIRWEIRDDIQEFLSIGLSIICWRRLKANSLCWEFLVPIPGGGHENATRRGRKRDSRGLAQLGRTAAALLRVSGWSGPSTRVRTARISWCAASASAGNARHRSSSAASKRASSVFG
jgi:hypothetical protein